MQQPQRQKQRQQELMQQQRVQRLQKQERQQMQRQQQMQLQQQGQPQEQLLLFYRKLTEPKQQQRPPIRVIFAFSFPLEISNKSSKQIPGKINANTPFTRGFLHFVKNPPKRKIYLACDCIRIFRTSHTLMHPLGLACRILRGRIHNPL